MLTSTVVRLETGWTIGFCPTRENTSTPSVGTAIRYLPLASVTTRVSVPCTRTVTPGNGVPVVDVTVPDTVVCCANAFALETSTKRTVIQTAWTRREFPFRNERVLCSIFLISNPPSGGHCGFPSAGLRIDCRPCISVNLRDVKSWVVRGLHTVL